MTDPRRSEVYEQTVRNEFAFLKSTASIDQLHARAIVIPGGAGLLVPVCDLHADDAQLIATLGRWREESSFAFPTVFPVTDEGTTRWLHALLGREDRILFLVLDRHGHAVGHMGYAGALEGDRELEIDNVVRGEGGGEPGLMSRAMEALVRWGQDIIGAREIHLRVFEDNEHAVRFYVRLGFEPRETIDLRREELDAGAYAFVPAEGEPAERRFLRMVHVNAPSEGTILTAGPSISGRESGYAIDAVRTGWNNKHSDYTNAFSKAFAEYVGVKHALPTSSCTGALHLSLVALGIGPGDEVIVPDITWVSTANAVTYTGATPVFADVQEQGWCLDPAAFETAITDRTKAVMPVHLYGHPADMAEIGRIAREHGVRIVEDAAPSIGAETAGRRTGGFGDAAGFSFQGAKLMVTGEGGMLVTDDDEVYERALYLWNMGHEGDFWIGETGFKYRLSNVQGALGLGQLERVDQLVEAKREIFDWYAEGLDGVPGIVLSHEAPWGRSIHWMTSIRVLPESGLTRDELRAAMGDAGIDTRPVFPAISRYPMWERRQLPGRVADQIGSQGINLPSGVCLRREDVERVCATIRETVRSKARNAA